MIALTTKVIPSSATITNRIFSTVRYTLRNNRINPTNPVHNAVQTTGGAAEHHGQAKAGSDSVSDREAQSDDEDAESCGQADAMA